MYFLQPRCSMFHFFGIPFNKFNRKCRQKNRKKLILQYMCSMCVCGTHCLCSSCCCCCLQESTICCGTSSTNSKLSFIFMRMSKFSLPRTCTRSPNTLQKRPLTQTAPYRWLTDVHANNNVCVCVLTGMQYISSSPCLLFLMLSGGPVMFGGVCLKSVEGDKGAQLK